MRFLVSGGIMVKRPSPIDVIEGFVGVQERVGDFVANGPSTGLGGHVRDQYRKRCDQFANLPPWARALNPGAQGTMGRVCKPYWDDSAVDGPVLSPPPFAGGQCPVNYTFQWQERRFSGGVWVWSVTFTRTVLGPISIGLNSNRAPFTCIGVAQFDNNAALFNGAGNKVATFQDACTDDPRGWRSISVSRADGQPDDCGDLPDEIEPGPNPPTDPGPTPGPEPTNDPRDPTGIPFLPVEPYDDPLGGPVPIEAEPTGGDGVGPDDIPGNTDSQEGGGENIGAAIPGEVGPSGSSDDIDFGEPPTGRVWVGCLLQFAIPTAYGIIPNSAPANPVAARIFGNASLVFENGRGTPLRLNGANIDLFRPNGALKVTGVFVNSLPGITFNVRPVSILKCPENACASEE